jgi:hypothetical protein
METLERGSSEIYSSFEFINLVDSVRKPFVCVHTFGLGVTP